MKAMLATMLVNLVLGGIPNFGTEMPVSESQAWYDFKKAGLEATAEQHGGSAEWEVLKSTDNQVEAEVTLLNREGMEMVITQTTLAMDQMDPAESSPDHAGDPPEWVTIYKVADDGGKSNKTRQITPEEMKDFLKGEED